MQTNIHNNGILFIISACSGAGKSTLINSALTKLKDKWKLERIITYTTRTARSCEINGIDYHFISQQEFESKINQNFFLEWSNTYGAYYGTPKEELSKLDSGISLFLIIDLDGFNNLLKLKIEQKIISIWITASTIEDLEKRLLKRSSETENQLKLRLSLAKKELNSNIISLFTYKLINSCEQKALIDLIEIVEGSFILNNTF